ncbi:hypothetical protein SGGMMB4_04349 [Sodalis glossinidius str. 'morsitans']|uniref:Uncharacterized protein n=1 Tax=Sodalis glossinidius (strain morsitans) TaxID=343509 RepID=A0A193QLM2_SODGM|nr:hypothetical protein SGGMMB4_04349 [Sodalis glossinidius str. 'morsitans']
MTWRVSTRGIDVKPSGTCFGHLMIKYRIGWTCILGIRVMGVSYSDYFFPHCAQVKYPAKRQKS